MIKTGYCSQKPGEVVIRGVVSDQDGTTIPGVSVVLKDHAGTASDADGKFALALPSLDGVVLTFTYRDEDTGNSREGCEDVERYLGGGFRDDSRSGGDRIYSRNKESFTGSFATSSKEDLKMIVGRTLSRV